MEVFLNQMARYNRIRWYKCLIPITNATINLSGGKQRQLYDSVLGYEDDEHNLNKAFEENDMMRCGIIVTIQMMGNFIFRNTDNAIALLQKYETFFAPRPMAQLCTVFGTFYSGLLAFHIFRETQDRHWLDRGIHAMRETETWAREGCKWNFENKALLLNAEYHFCIGDFDKAAERYELAITSSHNHHFVHEEAIANELAAYFQLERGIKDVSVGLTQRAIECYQSWGAEKKAAGLAQMIKQ